MELIIKTWKEKREAAFRFGFGPNNPVFKTDMFDPRSKSYDFRKARGSEIFEIYAEQVEFRFITAPDKRYAVQCGDITLETGTYL